MSSARGWLISVLLLCTGLAALAQPDLKPLGRHLADYDSELRRADGHVDTDALAARLGELGVTTYYWLIWHAPTDWDDLKVFLPKAGRAGIAVWVYLVPPSEGAAIGSPPSVPFGVDFPRWAEEIARLSLQHTNLTAWVIDDFYANHQLFTPASVGNLQSQAKRINPRLLFLPLMYFPEINHAFVEAYKAVIDGVVVAYPRDREEIAQARAILNGEATIAPGQLACPWNTPTRAGDFISATIPLRAIVPRQARLRFLEQDDFGGPTAGYHFKQVLVDGAVIWEEDVAGGTNGWRAVDLDLGAVLGQKKNATLAFRLFDKKGVSNFGVRWGLRQLRTEGLELAATFEQPQKWQVSQRGPFEAGFGTGLRPAPRRFHVPFIVMTAGSPDEFRLRHGDPASPERIAEWLDMCLQTRQAGLCDGVVTYCLDKTPASRTFPLAQDLFRKASKR